MNDKLKGNEMTDNPVCPFCGYKPDIAPEILNKSLGSSGKKAFLCTKCEGRFLIEKKTFFQVTALKGMLYAK